MTIIFPTTKKARRKTEGNNTKNFCSDQLKRFSAKRSYYTNEKTEFKTNSSDLVRLNLLLREPFFTYINNFINNFYILVPKKTINSKMVPARKNKSQNKKQLSQLDETLNDFVISSGTTVDTMRNEGLELQANGHDEDFGGIVNDVTQNQVIESNVDNRIRDVDNHVVIALENCMHEAILTAMNDMVIPRVEIAVTLITGSSGIGPNSIVQNPHRRDFTENTENTRLRLGSI